MIIREIVFLSLVSITIGAMIWREGRRVIARGKFSEAEIIKNVYCPSELTIIQNRLGLDDSESGMYYPVIQFMTDKNELITKQLGGSNPPRSVGTKFSVIYNPNNPSEIVTYPRVKLEVIPKLLVASGGIGLIFVVLEGFEIISIIPN